MLINSKSKHELTSFCFLLIRLTLAFATLVRFTACETITTDSQPSRISHKTTNLTTTTTSDRIHQISPNANDSPSSNDNNKSLILPTLDVTDLHIIPELRAAKLSWIYEFKAQNRPAAFSIKYCELTSWNDEIKCRIKQLEVNGQSGDHNYDVSSPRISRIMTKRHEVASNSVDVDDIATAPSKANPVIKSADANDPSATNATAFMNNRNGQSGTNHNNHLQSLAKISNNLDHVSLRGQILPNEDKSLPLLVLASYEAQIYDLRAQTNYTFQVKVSSFIEIALNQAISNFKDSEPVTSRSSGPIGRRLLSGQWRQQPIESTSSNEISDTSGGHNSGRSSTLSPSSPSNLVAETKGFAAEATRCLADVSEVVVNTGRYFGGRISVEDSQDPRCRLLGNRSSEQTSYLFRIDHAACRSKLVAGNHIETIVLVHENKDILTHNTARFLVLCNFLQNSFTLKASVSLPKVNGLMSSQKQLQQLQQHQDQAPRTIAANITQLRGKPLATSAVAMGSNALLHRDMVQYSTPALHDQPVKLGSMPGFFRSKLHNQQQQQQQQFPSKPRFLDLDSAIANNRIQNHNLKLDYEGQKMTSTISVPLVADSLQVAPSQLVQSGELETTARVDRSSNGDSSLSLQPRTRNLIARARSLPMQFQERVTKTLDANNDLSMDSSDAISGAASGPKAVILPMAQPESVQVQSQVLFISPPTNNDPSSGSAREARQLLPNGVSLIRSAASLQRMEAAAKLQPQNELRSTSNILARKLPLDGFDGRSLSANEHSDDSASGVIDTDDRSSALVLTNNHRVSDNFPSLSTPSQSTIPLKHNSNTSASTKSLRTEETSNFDQNFTIKYSAAHDVDNYSVSDQVGAVEPVSSSQLQSWTPIEVSGTDSINASHAMGDPMYRERAAKSLGDAANNLDQYTLAQNITNQLLKFSLKTLTNVARRTVELLVKGAENNGARTNNEISANRSLLGGSAEERDQASKIKSTNDLALMNMNVEDDDYEESDQPTTSNFQAFLAVPAMDKRQSQPQQLATSAPKSTIDYNNNNNNQGREHVNSIKKIQSDNSASSTSTLSGDTSLRGDRLKVADGNNTAEDTAEISVTRKMHEIDGNKSNLTHQPQPSTQMATDNKLAPAKTISQIDSNDNNQDGDRDSSDFDTDTGKTNNTDDQIAATVPTTTTTTRPLNAPRLTTRFNLDFRAHLEELPGGSLATSSKNLQNQPETSSAESSHSDSMEANWRAPSGAVSSHRSSGSRALKYPDDKSNAGDSSLKSNHDGNISNNDNNGLAIHTSREASRRFNEVFEFRESPAKRRSLMFWPLFSLILLACIASAFVISIWFVSFNSHHYFSGASNFNNANGMQGDGNNINHDNQSETSNRRDKRKVAEISGITTQNSANRSCLNSVNKESYINGAIRDDKQVYPHSNNARSHSKELANNAHAIQTEITSTNHQAANCAGSNLILEDVTREKGDVCVPSVMIYAMTTSNSKLTDSSTIGANCCERALSPSIRTLSPSFPYKTNHNHDDDYRCKSYSIGFENNRSENNFTITTNQQQPFYDDNFVSESPFNQAKQVNSLNDINQKNISHRGATPSRLANRPRSHCSSRRSDRTTSTSRSSFSQSTSISNGSTTLIANPAENQENLCRDTEVLFSEHVLINLGSLRGESYA